VSSGAAQPEQSAQAAEGGAAGDLRICLSNWINKSKKSQGSFAYEIAQGDAPLGCTAG
jgi:hypothetical protein